MAEQSRDHDTITGTDDEVGKSAVQAPVTFVAGTNFTLHLPDGLISAWV